MKIRNLLIILTTLLLSWLLPMFGSMFSSSHTGRLMVHFSSITQHFCIVERDTETEEIIRRDLTTNEHYTLNQFDSILPLLYYRQLLADGRMPDSIQGKAISAKEANEKRFYFKHKPKDSNTPTIDLFPLFESKSGRIDLKMPDDLFRLKNKLEFINPENNEIEYEKTAKFQKIFKQKNFSFPAKKVSGEPSPLKPYDEGYFIIDNANNLYHFKMIQSEPFLRKVELPKNLLIEDFVTSSPDDRSFYGFITDKNGFVYVLNTNNYTLQKLDCGKVDLKNEILAIMGNPIYWTIRVITRGKEDVFAFNSSTKEKVAEHHFTDSRKGGIWQSYIFPFHLSWTSMYSNFVVPKIKIGANIVLILNTLLIILFFFLTRKKHLKYRIIESIWIILTGIFGFVACLIFTKK